MVVAPPKSRWYKPRQLAIAASIALGTLMIPVAARRLPALQNRPEYQVGCEQITMSPAPHWIPADLARQVFEKAGLKNREPLQDPQLSERVAAAFHSHPWIEKVVSVRKSFPARVHVDVVYREPAAMVRGVDGFYPVDRHGTLLPARDFSPSDVERYPVIERVSSVPLGTLGEPWGDPAVSGAALLASTLNQSENGKPAFWSEMGLAAIVVPQRVALAENADELQFELRTSGGTLISWGRSPASRHPGELTAAQKMQRLADFRRDFGGFDDPHGPWQIDIRPWQGIQRSTLARQHRDTELQ